MPLEKLHIWGKKKKKKRILESALLGKKSASIKLAEVQEQLEKIFWWFPSIWYQMLETDTRSEETHFHPARLHLGQAQESVPASPLPLGRKLQALNRDQQRLRAPKSSSDDKWRCTAKVIMSYITHFKSQKIKISEADIKTDIKKRTFLWGFFGVVFEKHRFFCLALPKVPLDTELHCQELRMMLAVEGLNYSSEIFLWERGWPTSEFKNKH